jgi:hypothetical protein
MISKVSRLYEKNIATTVKYIILKKPPLLLPKTSVGFGHFLSTFLLKPQQVFKGASFGV